MKRPHDGGKCPVPPDTLVRVWVRGASAWICSVANDLFWPTTHITHYEILIPQDEAQTEIDAAKTERDSAIARAEFLSAELKALREQMPQRSRRDQFIRAAMGHVYASTISHEVYLEDIAKNTVAFADAVIAEADRERT
jgi:hypothetical protein